MSAQYKNYAESFTEIEDNLHNMRLSFDSFRHDSNDYKLSGLKSDIEILNASLDRFNKQRDLFFTPNSQAFIEYEMILYLLQAKMSEFALAITKFEKDPAESREKEKSELFSNHYIEDIDRKISYLEGVVLDSFTQNLFYGEIKHKEKMLFWSVFVMGFCGFLLVVLNTNKLRELESLNIERRQTLKVLENRLEALDAAREGIFIMNSDDVIVYMNKSFVQISGKEDFDKDAPTDKTWADIFSRSDCEVIEEDILPELFEDGFWVGEFQLYREDNTSFHTEMSLTRLPDGGLIGTVQDVSYKKEAEQEKNELENQFYQAQKMEAIGRLAGGMAHDFNNILAAMNGYTEFLLDDLEEGSEQRKFAKNILQAGVQARELVDQMLAFSRRSDSAKSTLDMVDSVNEVLSMMRATVPKTIELKTDINVDRAVIKGNQTQISQLIMNLCVNGQDAIENQHGKLTVSLNVAELSSIDIEEVIQEDLPDTKVQPYLRIDDMEAGRSRLVLGNLSKNAEYIKLSVVDSGSGMSHAIMEHIFEPFFTTKPVDKGTGLGLATVHGVLVGHQGFMIIDSTLGKGTTFELYFPLEEAAASRVEEVEKGDKPKEKKEGEGHILLIEDQENVRDMVLKMLERMGYQTSSAVSGMEGLDLIRENPDGYDVVITDYNMPKMTGLEMINQIYEDLPELPFIVLSGYSEDKMQEMIDEHPAIRAVLRKPVSKDVLSAKIQDVIDQSVAA